MQDLGGTPRHMFFFFKQKTAYEITRWLEFRRVLFRSDLLFAMYASQNFEFFESLTTRFPTETHQQNLEAVVRIGPRTVVPASAGFRFCGVHEWLNAFLFPISRARFVDDLGQLSPQTGTIVMKPGDVIDIDGEHIRHRPAAPVP